MSSCCGRRCCGVNQCSGYGGATGCNFSCLVILILILLYFSKKKGNSCFEENSCSGFLDGCGLDGGIIFIITLFYLSCSRCGNGFGSC